MNRDWKRIADTELANTENLAGILEEVRAAPEGGKVYFKRYELADCCPKCAAVNGKVVLWSDTPLSDEKVKDEYTDTAIWDGKKWEKGKTVLVPGTLHPHCRGGWLPWGGKEADAMLAKHDGKSEEWDNAVDQARAEYQQAHREESAEERQEAGGDELLRYRGKMAYNPETGEPLKKKEFDALIQGIEKFLNRNTKDTGKRIILDAAAIEKLLKRMAKYKTAKEMEALKLNKAHKEESAGVDSAEVRQEAQGMSPARKRAEAARLTQEQMNKEFAVGTYRPELIKHPEIADKRRRELYLKYCAELGVDTE